MTISSTCKGAWLGAVLTLALASPALAAPAGDEYLPEVPKASGGGADAGAAGAGSGAVSSDASAAEAESGTEGDGRRNAEGEGEKGKSDEGGVEDESAPTAAVGGSDDDDGSGLLDTVLDPVVLLLIVGVIATALGMTLRRRQGDDHGPDDPGTPRRDRSKASPTPDGEIAGGGEQPS